MSGWVRLRVEAYRNGRARPDGALAPVAHFAGQGEWADPNGVVMAVEIRSYDRRDQSRAYAAVGISVYLLIDRDDSMLMVRFCPRDGRYRDVHSASFGERIILPEPEDITLDTDLLKRYVH